jgi:hypothetical protein
MTMANSNRDQLGRWASASISSAADAAPRGAASSFAALPTSNRPGTGGPPSVTSTKDTAPGRSPGGGYSALPTGAGQQPGDTNWGTQNLSKALTNNPVGGGKGGGMKPGGGGGFTAQPRPEMDLTPMGGGSGTSGGDFGGDNGRNDQALRASGYGDPAGEGPGMHRVQTPEGPGNHWDVPAGGVPAPTDDFGGRAGHGADIPGGGTDFGGVEAL